MILYIPTSGSNTAQALSNALWGLARPVTVRGDDVTQEMFGSMMMSNASVWLQVDTEFTIPVHPEAVLDGIADILQPFIDAGQLPADTNTELESFILANRGGTMVPYQAFPQLFKDQAKTESELRILGLWPAP